MPSSFQRPRVSSRRHFLQRTLSGVAGWALWHGWPARHHALAQKETPTGQLTWAMHITLAPTWFDPAETGALQTPYLCLRALHDALVKPMPDGPMSPFAPLQGRALTRPISRRPQYYWTSEPDKTCVYRAPLIPIAQFPPKTLGAGHAHEAKLSANTSHIVLSGYNGL